jgi:hypothetical protein
MTSDRDASDGWSGDARGEGASVGKMLIGITVAIAMATFAFDLSLPLGVAGGVPYVALVLMGVWFQRARDIYILAVLGSALTIVGYLTSPSGGVF